MDFITFETAKKLKEKGYPQVKQNTLAMYDELGRWYSMAETIDEAYSFEDFDEYDCVCPTISQVLKWLREKLQIHISTKPYPCEDGLMWMYEVRKFSSVLVCVVTNKTGFQEPEQAELAGIKYVLDNLI